MILVKGKSNNISYSGLAEAFTQHDNQLRLFGKPEVDGERRMGVCLAKGNSIEEARKKANEAAGRVLQSFA